MDLDLDSIIPVVLLDFEVFGLGLAPLLRLSAVGHCFSGDGLRGSDLILIFSTRLEVVGLDTNSFTLLSDASFFWPSLPFTDAWISAFNFVDVLARDVFVTVALDVALGVGSKDDEDVLLKHNRNEFNNYNNQNHEFQISCNLPWFIWCGIDWFILCCSMC